MSRLTGAGLGFLAVVLSACGGADTISPRTPPRVSIVAGDNQSATAGQVLPVPLTVSVISTTGDPVVGQMVTWTVLSGDGTLSASSVGTDASGQASVNWTLGPGSGLQAVAASIEWTVGDGLTKFGVPFLATAVAPGPPPPPPPTPQPVILHYDGSAWSVAVEKMSDQPVLLNSVWGASGSDLFAVGTLCGQALIMRYDGASWTQSEQTCAPFAFGRDEASVWGSSGSSVFTVVRSAPSPRTAGASIYNYDGASWTLPYNRSCSSPPVCDPYLNAVWTGAPNFVTAVGDSGFIVHYDGTAWTQQPSGTARRLRAVWANGTGGSAAMFAVGDTGTIISYNGSAWTAMASGTTEPLYGIWGASANDVFAVGGNGIILHYDGNAWSEMDSPSLLPLYGVWGTSGNSVFAVGDAGTVLRFDGTNWNFQSATSSINLRGVWGSSATNVFAVGHPR